MQRIAEEDLQHILTNTIGLWEKVRNKSIFITGATGFFGKWFLESFMYVNNNLSLNATVSALSRDPEAFLKEIPFFKHSSINFIKGNIQTFDFPEGDYHFVIHAATDSDAQKNIENLLLMIDTITNGTRRVLEFAQEKSVGSFLFTSSGAVYGTQLSTVTHIKEDETFPIDMKKPVAAYAEGKRLAEVFCSIYHSYYQLPVKIARCFAFVGPYLPLDKHFAIGNFILNAVNKENIVIKGDGTPYRSYLYASDLMIWLWTILLNGKDNTPYNVGSDEALSLRELAHVFKEIQPGIEVKILTPPEESKPVERYVPNIDMAKQTLGLDVKIKLKEAIEKTISFYGSI